MTQLANAWSNWAARPAFVRLLKFLALSIALHAATLNLTVAVRNPGQPQGYVIRAELVDPAPVVGGQPEVAPQEPAPTPSASIPSPARVKPSEVARVPTPQPAAATSAPTEPPAQAVVEPPLTPELEATPMAEATPAADAVAASEPLAEAPPVAVEPVPATEPVIAAPVVTELPPAPSAATAPTLPAAPVRATAPVLAAAPVREIVVARADETQLTQSATAGFALRHPDISATPRITPPQPKAEPLPVAAKSVEVAPAAAAASEAPVLSAPAEPPAPAPLQAATEVSPAPAAAEAKQVPVIIARNAAVSSNVLPTLTLPQRAQPASRVAPAQASAAREVAVIRTEPAAAAVAAPSLTLPPRQLPPSANVPAAPSDSAVKATPAQAMPPSAPVTSPSAPAAVEAAPPAASSAVAPPPVVVAAPPPPSPGPSVDDVLPQPGQAPQQVASLAHSLPVPLRFESTEAALAALPKSARIEYVFRRGERGLNLGRLKLHWQLDGAQYSVRSEGETTGIFAIFFQGKHRMESRGSVTPQGLMPEFFQEERTYKGRRLEQVAFDRANKALVYSNEKDTRSAPLAEGTQDILSILFQFALDPPKSGRFTSTFTTARKLETFEYEVSAQETLELAGKRVETIRLTPRDARGRASIEVWLAINDHHLPVKVRFVDRKGNITEQIATNIHFE